METIKIVGDKGSATEELAARERNWCGDCWGRFVAVTRFDGSWKWTVAGAGGGAPTLPRWALLEAFHVPTQRMTAKSELQLALEMPHS